MIGRAAYQHGMALVTSLLLLIIITILALSMFRSFGIQERMAGNLREKDRALHAATSAQQYAEWWLLQSNNAALTPIPCAGGLLFASAGQGQICANQLDTGLQNLGVPVIATPWTVGGAQVGVVFQPPGMTLGAGTPGNPGYAAFPVFYIADLGVAADGQGETYRIDAFGNGGSAQTVAVVESTYEVQQGVVPRGGL